MHMAFDLKKSKRYGSLDLNGLGLNLLPIHDITVEGKAGNLIERLKNDSKMILFGTTQGAYRNTQPISIERLLMAYVHEAT